MESSTYSNAPDLDDTSERQAALRRYHILDTAPEKNFDRITSLVAKVCDVPTALITLIDEERQWFKSCFGFDARETDIGVSFCVHAVHQGEMLVIEDATEDPRFKENPIVTGPPHVRFYAGAPLTTPEGVHIGTLCILDYEARTFDASQREILERLADVVVNQFELRSAEAQVRQLVNENPQPMYVYAENDGSLMYVNEAAREEYGYDKSDFASMTADALEAPPEDQPSAPALAMHERGDGSYVPVRVREHQVLFNGQPAQLAVPQPVSERYNTESTVFFRTDLEGRTQSLSAEWEAATGFSVPDTIGRPFTGFVHPLDRSSTAEAFSALLDGETDVCRHEASFLTDRGEQAFELHARLMRDDSGSPAGVAGTLTPLLNDTSDPSPSPADDAASASDAPVDDAAAADESAFPPSLSDEPDEDAPSSPDAPLPGKGEDAEDAPVDDAVPADDAAPATGAAPAEPSAAPEPSAPADSEAHAPDEQEADAPAEPTDDASDDSSTDGEDPDEAYDVFSPSLPTFSDEGFEDPVPTDAADENDAAPDSPSTDRSAPDSDLTDTPVSEIELSPEPFDLVAHTHAILDRHDGDAQAVELRRSLPAESVPVRLDPSAVETIVDTLIDNALSHTDAGTVTVRAEAREDDVTLHVEDTGSDVEKRFMKVYMDEGESAEASGLHRVHQLVGRMDGSLSMENAEHGTHFALTLPRSSVAGGDGQSSLLPSDQ